MRTARGDGAANDIELLRVRAIKFVCIMSESLRRYYITITSVLPSTPQAINTAAMESFRIDLMRTARGDGAANGS